MGVEPRSSRLHYWLRQAVLCLLLAGAIGVAAAVQRYRLRSLRVPLDALRTVGVGGGRFMVQMPSGWTSSAVAGGVRLEEGADRGQFPRQLLIARQMRAEMITPLEYLAEGGLERAESDIRPAVVARWPGLLVGSTQRIRPMDGGEMRLRRTLSATTVLPTREVVSVQLSGEGPADASDEDLVIRVAESIALEHPMPPAPASGEFALADGVRVSLPDRFVTAPMDDPYRVGLRVVGGDAAGWLGLEIVPCILLPGQGAETLAAMLACRDPLRPAAKPIAVDANVFVCRSSGQGGLTQSAACLVRGPEGQAVLVELRGDLVEARQLDALWRSIAGSVRFDGASEVRAALDRGVEALVQIASDPADLIAELPAVQRWLWYHEDEPAAQWRWSEEKTRLADAWVEGTREAVLKGPDGRALHVGVQWRMTRDLGQYGFEVEREGKKVARRSFHALATTGPTRPASEESGSPMPAGFVPGALLPAVLGKCPDEKLVLRTDSLLIADGIASEEPLTILVEPSNDRPRRQDHTDRPMRCLAVTVNGTGEATRWYFDDEGVLQYIDLAGGMHVKRE